MNDENKLPNAYLTKYNAHYQQLVVPPNLFNVISSMPFSFMDPSN